MTEPFPRRMQILAEMNQAHERGDLDKFYRLQQEHLAELTGAGRRADANEAAASEEESDGINWANVASEARTMLDLNRTAMENWQDDRPAATGKKSQDG